MKTVKLVASAATIFTGILGAYAGLVLNSSGGSHFILTVLGVALILDSLACLYGANLAFAVAAVVSAALAVAGVVWWGSGYTGIQWTTLSFAMADVVLSALAFRSSTGLSEEANPMNLPVFG